MERQNEEEGFQAEGTFPSQLQRGCRDGIFCKYISGSMMRH